MIRIVKMTFQPNRVGDFLENFEKHKTQIRGFEGCEELRLLRDKKSTNIFFTYSRWKSPNDLENYRHSELFKGVWDFTKALFSEKPEAWSTDELEVLL